MTALKQLLTDCYDQSSSGSNSRRCQDPLARLPCSCGRVLPEFTTGLATTVVLMTQALLAQQSLRPSTAATSTRNISSSNSGSSKSVIAVPHAVAVLFKPAAS